MSEPMEVEDAVASTLATPFAQPIIAASKSKAQKQREYRQRIAASRTPAQAAAARKSKNERQRNNRLRKAANLAIASGALEATTTSSSRSVPKTAAPKTRAQIQREYRQRIAASKTPAQAAAAREARNVRDRNNRLCQAANFAIASSSLEATTTSSSRSGQRLNIVHIDTQRQFTDQQRQTLATEQAETTVQPSTSSDQIEVQAQSTWNTKWASSITRFKSTFFYRGSSKRSNPRSSPTKKFIHCYTNKRKQNAPKYKSVEMSHDILSKYEPRQIVSEFETSENLCSKLPFGIEVKQEIRDRTEFHTSELDQRRLNQPNVEGDMFVDKFEVKQEIIEPEFYADQHEQERSSYFHVNGVDITINEVPCEFNVKQEVNNPDEEIYQLVEERSNQLSVDPADMLVIEKFKVKQEPIETNLYTNQVEQKKLNMSNFNIVDVSNSAIQCHLKVKKECNEPKLYTNELEQGRPSQSYVNVVEVSNSKLPFETTVKQEIKEEPVHENDSVSNEVNFQKCVEREKFEHSLDKVDLEIKRNNHDCERADKDLKGNLVHKILVSIGTKLSPQLVLQGYTYIRSDGYKPMCWRCSKGNACKASIRVDGDLSLLSEIPEHSHPPPELHLNPQGFYTKLRNSRGFQFALN